MFMSFLASRTAVRGSEVVESLRISFSSVTISSIRVWFLLLLLPKQTPPLAVLPEQSPPLGMRVEEQDRQ